MNDKKKIEWKKCKKCGFLQYETHLRCLKCKSHDFTKLEAWETCKLLTYTVLTALPTEFQDKKYYALGVAEFKNGIKILGQITTPQNLRIGMDLKPEYKKVCDNLDGKEVYDFILKVD